MVFCRVCQIYGSFTSILTYFIPSVFILCINIAIIYKLSLNQRHMTDIGHSGKDAAQDRNSQLTRLLIAISIMFLIFK